MDSDEGATLIDPAVTKSGDICWLFKACWTEYVALVYPFSSAVGLAQQEHSSV
jgi:hypothetical protein